MPQLGPDRLGAVDDGLQTLPAELPLGGHRRLVGGLQLLTPRLELERLGLLRHVPGDPYRQRSPTVRGLVGQALGCRLPGHDRFDQRAHPVPQVITEGTA